MYKLLNKLFGWDYINWNNGVASGISRVHTEIGTGRAFYFRYKTTKVVDKIRSKDQVIWLTCPPDKYFLDWG